MRKFLLTAAAGVALGLASIPAQANQGLSVGQGASDSRYSDVVHGQQMSYDLDARGRTVPDEPQNTHGLDSIG